MKYVGSNMSDSDTYHLINKYLNDLLTPSAPAILPYTPKSYFFRNKFRDNLNIIKGSSQALSCRKKMGNSQGFSIFENFFSKGDKRFGY